MVRKESAIFLFHRDLRVEDNSGLILAHKNANIIHPLFIFDERQVGNNEYRSVNALEFLVGSLKELNKAIQDLTKNHTHLQCQFGITEQIIADILSKKNIGAIYSNRDYTPFAKQRDKAIKSICEKNNVLFFLCADGLLNEPEMVKKADGKPYTIFTPYFNKAKCIEIPKPVSLISPQFELLNLKIEPTLDDLEKKFLPQRNPVLASKPGRINGLRILEEIEQFKDYEKTHDIPSIPGTSRISAHLKFGTISIREAYWAIANRLGVNHPLIRQLYWHDFFTQIAFYFPHVFGKAYHSKYDQIPWVSDLDKFKAWCDGTTGFPIVDAGMRELNTTGFMHNRVRMIVASFLTKDLHIDWRWGEKYFAQHLIDYDPAVNNGNWQWSASTGCDSQPYFRIFNPWTQGEKFDPDAIYIKRWIPELSHVPSQNIHKLFNPKYQIAQYPKPIIDHTLESKKTKFLYASISQNAKAKAE
jgi:deoxyribodipyrimidine photo-lyase